jgi:hypothetical protein
MENWRAIVGYGGFYEVSDLGRVRSLARFVRHGKREDYYRRIPGKIRKLCVAKSSGHVFVGLSSQGASENKWVHSLVLAAFVGDPKPGQECRHLDGDPTNNALTNLAWGSRRANMADREIHGTAVQGSKHGNAVLDEEKVRAIKRAPATVRNADLARRYQVAPATISGIRLGKQWRHVA